MNQITSAVAANVCPLWRLGARERWGIMGLMGMALDYAREKAPVSVLGSLDWLASAGFVVVAERGGPHESFGNLLVVFERSTLAVRITRDRGQWSIELAPAAVSSSRSMSF